MPINSEDNLKGHDQEPLDPDLSQNLPQDDNDIDLDALDELDDTEPDPSIPSGSIPLGSKKRMKKKTGSAPISMSAATVNQPVTSNGDFETLDFGIQDVLENENSDNRSLHDSIHELSQLGDQVTLPIVPFAVGSLPKVPTRKTGLEGFSSRKRVNVPSDMHQAYNYTRNVNWMSRSHGPSSRLTTDSWVKTHVLSGPMKKFYVAKPNHLITIPLVDKEASSVHDIRTYDKQPLTYHLEVPSSNAKNGDSFYYELGDQLSLDDALFSAFNVVFLLSKRHLYRHHIPLDWRFQSFTHQSVAAQILHLGDGWLVPYIYEEHSSSRDGFIHHARMANALLTINVSSPEYPSLYVFMRTK